MNPRRIRVLSGEMVCDELKSAQLETGDFVFMHVLFSDKLVRKPHPGARDLNALRAEVYAAE